MAEARPQKPGTRRAAKAPGAFRTISEVSEQLSVPQHVLRFWETKFSQVRPLKRGGRRRYYRPEDVVLLRSIRGLLYDDGYTIRGVQKVLREGIAPRLNVSSADDESQPVVGDNDSQDSLSRQRLRLIADELTRLREMLKKAKVGT